VYGIVCGPLACRLGGPLVRRLGGPLVHRLGGILIVCRLGGSQLGCWLWMALLLDRLSNLEREGVCRLSGLGQGVLDWVTFTSLVWHTITIISLVWQFTTKR
jgi:hypothetical protein